MKDSEESKPNAAELAKAVKLVQAAIRAEEARLKQIAEAEEQDPIMLEGVTYKDYPCHLMVDPKDVAEVFLEYHYPMWSILEEEPPEEMWHLLAERYGLDAVCSVDL